MTYYKVIQNGIIVDVGSAFAKWNLAFHRMFYCEVNEGEFVISLDNTKFYRDNWMKTPPEEATGYELAKVVIIDDAEYIELYRQLTNNVEVLEEAEEELDIVSFSEVEQTQEPEEKVLTVVEMQKMLLAQQEQIEALTNLLNSKNS